MNDPGRSALGAGMVSLAVVLTIFHLVTLFVVAPAVRKIPTVDRNRAMHIDCADGQGVLRQILEIATTKGFSSPILRTLVLPLMDLNGVASVIVRGSDSSGDDDED